MLSESNGSIDTQERHAYINKIKETLQNKVVKFVSGEMSTMNVITWVDRSTACDVVSIVTTTVPVKNGEMRDIRIYNKELRKYVFYQKFINSNIITESRGQVRNQEEVLTLVHSKNVHFQEL